MEAAAALSPPRVAVLDARALFSPPTAIPSSPVSRLRLRLAARPRASAPSVVATPKQRFLTPHPDPAGGRGARDVVTMVQFLHLDRCTLAYSAE
jgi:hypothetical protein